jgi:hypothetical protein
MPQERENEVSHHRADVAELADALDSGSSSRKGVEVQVLSSAPMKSIVAGQQQVARTCRFRLCNGL